MENTAATGLPGVDSLPDGFVDSSSTDPLCPPTPNIEQEKPLIDYSPSNLSGRNESILEESSGSESRTTRQSRTENTQKPRNFPVPLSQVEGEECINASFGLVNDDDKGYKDHYFGAAISAAPDFIEVHSDTSGRKLSGCIEEKEQAHGKFQSSESRNRLYLPLNTTISLVSFIVDIWLLFPISDECTCGINYRSCV